MCQIEVRKMHKAANILKSGDILYASYCHKSHKKAKTTINLSASFYL